MSRVRERQDYFQWRGDRYAFHQLVDGPSLARLDPYCDDEQRWPLHSRRIIFPTGSEVRDIARQVQGLELPESRPEGMAFAPVSDPELEGRVASLEERVAKLEAKLAEQPKPAEPVEVVVEADEFHIPDTPPLPYDDEAEVDEPEEAPVVETEPAPEPAPYEPNFTVIPDRLAKYAEADESAEDFRKRAFSLLFRFGIAEGENFEGGGEPLTAEEKIKLLPMLIANFEAGNWLRLSEELKPD